MAATFLNAPGDPRPADGAWLLKSKTERQKGQKRLQSFLRYVEHDEDEGGVEVGEEMDDRNGHATFLRMDEQVGKERTAYGRAPGVDIASLPRTIANDGPRSHAHHGNSTLGLTHSSTPLASFLRDPVDSAYTLDNATHIQDPVDEQADNTMVPPPHKRSREKMPVRSKDRQGDDTLRPLTKISDHVAPAKTTEDQNVSANATTTQTSEKDIREKLEQNYGVKVSEPKPAAAAQGPSSGPNEEPKPAPASSTKPPGTTKGSGAGAGGKSKSPKGDQRAEAGSSKHSKPKDKQSERRGRGRGAGRATQGNKPKASRWPTTAETKADPRDWDIRWSSDEEQKKSSIGDEVDSDVADSGFGQAKTKTKKKKQKHEEGIDPETGFELMDWNGKWAPAPIDWDARPPFRDGQSAEQIMRWMDCIEQDMSGKDWGVSLAELGAVTANTTAAQTDKEGLKVGDVAPRYWIPVTLGRQESQNFWDELVKSDEPKPHDEQDLDGVKPWWQMYETEDHKTLPPYEQPFIEGVDPDESQEQRIARENDRGSDHFTDNRKRAEKAKREAKREKKRRAEEKARELAERAPIPNPDAINPGVKMFIRSAKPDDIPSIRSIYNHYVSNTVSAPEMERVSHEDMEARYNAIIANKLPFLVACERGAKLAGRSRRGKGEAITLPDTVIGFAFADDFNDTRGMYRFTAEMHVYVDNRYYLKGVAKCLLDKLMALLDEDYMERGGYDTEGEELDGLGPSRVIQHIVVNFPWEKPERLEWMRRWLGDWLDFKQVGELMGNGNKEGVSVNLTTFHRTTGSTFDPARPPIMN